MAKLERDSFEDKDIGYVKMLSEDLKKRGFVFVGSTICYSMMQAVGMVNDHTVSCFKYKESHVLST